MSWLRDLRRYPSAIAAVAVIGIFVFVSLYAVIAVPRTEAVRLWRAGPGVWQENARRAPPIWHDWFTSDRLPRTMVIRLDDAIRMAEPIGDGMQRVEIVLPFNYDYDRFPKEISLFTEASFEAGFTFISLYWIKPDGEVITLQEDRRAGEGHGYRISQDGVLRGQLGAHPHVGLFARELGVPAADMELLRGDYRLVIEAEMAEGDEFHATDLVVYGQVEGWAGTDHRRRDIMVALLWGTPIALAFGVIGAVGAMLSTFVLAGIGTWWGGKVDALFHRLTELNMILPMLPILIAFAHFYSRSLWVMLGLIILFNIFSAAMKTYRAMFLQAKEASYIEASQAYGAGNWRIVFRYLLPRTLPVLLPQFVMAIPTFVFLEASLAVLGLGDPTLPTWGKVIYDARVNDALYMGQYYWMVLPSLLLMGIGLSFALLGFSLDRVVNPRLRTV